VETSITGIKERKDKELGDLFPKTARFGGNKKKPGRLDHK